MISVGVFPQDVLSGFYLGLIILCDTLNYLISRSFLLCQPIDLSLKTLILQLKWKHVCIAVLIIGPVFAQELNNTKCLLPESLWISFMHQ